MASIGAMGDLLKQAQEMQSRMAKIQEQLAGKTVQGSSGGGMVQVTINGQFHVTAVQIEPSVINAAEKQMLEDLILAAMNDGMRKAIKDWQSARGHAPTGELTLMQIQELLGLAPGSDDGYLG